MKKAGRTPGRIYEPPTTTKGVLLSSLYPTDPGEAIAVLYDLRDPAQWAAAGEQRRAWGRERTEIHTLDVDHVVVEFQAGGARELST